MEACSSESVECIERTLGELTRVATLVCPLSLKEVVESRFSYVPVPRFVNCSLVSNDTIFAQW